jgi:putative transposase
MPNYIDNHFYHVYNRGAHRYPIFHKPVHYRKCIESLQKYASHYHVSFLAYCLMPNHYHLLVHQDPNGTVSRFLQTTFNTYVQYFNAMERHSGTLFQGPAKSRAIETDEYLMRVVRYIHCNPVLAKLARSPIEWRYSDYATWIGGGDVAFAGKSLRDAWFKNGEGYRKFVEKYKAETLGPSQGLGEFPGP